MSPSPASVGEAVRRAAAAGIERIIVEVDRLDQIEPALAAGATHLLLDNMDVAGAARGGRPGRRPRADRGERRRHPRHDPRQGRDRRHLHLGRPHHPVGAGGRYRPGFRQPERALELAAAPRTSPSITAVSGWCLSSQRLTILRLRVFERKRKSTGSRRAGDRGRAAMSKPTLPAIRARWHFDMPRLRASQTSQAPIAAVTTSPTTGIRPSDRRRGRSCGWCPGMVKARSSSASIASIRCRTEAGSRPIGSRFAVRSKSVPGSIAMLRTRSAIRFTAGMPRERVGPEAGQPRRDQRPAHRRGQRDERRQAGKDPVGDGELRLALRRRAAPAGRPAAPGRRPDRRSALASQVKWRRYQLARLAGATSSMQPQLGRLRRARRASASTPISRQSRRRWAKTSR